MMSLECLHEFNQNFFFSSLSRFDFWVAESVIFIMEFFNGDGTVVVDVKGLESLNDQILSHWAHFTNNYSDEFIEINGTACIDVHGLE